MVKKTKKKSRKRTKVIFFAAVAILLYFVFFGDNSIFNIIQSHRELQRVSAEVDRMHKTIDSLQKEIHRLRTDTAYIEKIAREKLGMAKKDETIYKFIERKNH
jgi:cell division protein FtsB